MLTDVRAHRDEVDDGERDDARPTKSEQDEAATARVVGEGADAPSLATGRRPRPLGELLPLTAIV